ncbi:MAG: ceramidase [Sulfuricaulis sp.]|uniref:DUF6962 family protein n=1 Tax=Sulfuricaulis sp. TaxID=2003553 RepID=UPI0025FD7BA8|nr:ceramidase domain-containing protein [Sulfuricaulis sp.]MCR4346114.1 ceramidase [Sulfuricaulis sp.]
MRQTLVIIFLLAAFVATGIFLLPSIAQDPTYHDFADRRGLLGIPNFLNITSNLAFLAVGIAGIILYAGNLKLVARRAWIACFTGVMLVCFGSGYYHLAPDNNTLVWDRLPMSIGFMGLLVAVLVEYVNPRLEKYLLAPAIVLGLASVVYWHYTDDLRLYVLVQFLPLLMIPVILLLFGETQKDRGYLLMALAIYVLAKLAEHFDRAVFELTGNIISGHSLKHLLAAIALFVVYWMLRRRAPGSPPVAPAVRSSRTS